MKKLIFMGCALLSTGLVFGTQATESTARDRSVSMNVDIEADVHFVIEFQEETLKGETNKKQIILCNEGGKASEDQRTVAITPTHDARVTMGITCDFEAKPTNNKAKPFPYWVIASVAGEKHELRTQKDIESITENETHLKKGEKISFVFDYKDNNDIQPGKYNSSFILKLTPAQ